LFFIQLYLTYQADKSRTSVDRQRFNVSNVFVMRIQTLENIPVESLLDVFNLSFSDYLVPFRLTQEQLEDKIKSDSIQLEFSVGAFENNELVAFILHGYDIIDNRKIVYNAGTGVIPTKRGNKLTKRLYEYALPILHENEIDKVVLEVITINEPAIKTYRSIGFKITRELDCFKGSINIINTNSDFQIREMKEYDWQTLRSFWDFQPSWQNNSTAVENLQQSNLSIGVYDNEKLLGYVIFNPRLKRLHQLAVDKSYRKRGIGGQLLKQISALYGNDISIINIDSSSKETLQFLTGIGMNMYVKQYEMELTLK
jgi:ribosomal protein S18 acetylase RimI-like enzyme